MIVAQHYEIVERLAAGGEARVYRARHLLTGAEVALRLSLTDDAPQLLSQLPRQHPGWARMLDGGVDPVYGAYTVFELLRGETLGAMMARGPLAADAWHLFVGASLEAIEALHRADWVHGDLNADNFLLHQGTTWKLLDLPFHVAPVKKASPFFGSIYTMAPEQFAGRAPDRRSDLYSLGCLYYAAAAGVYPHAGGSEADIAVGRLRFPPTQLRELPTNLLFDEAEWVMHLLSTDPAERPADIAAARQLLRRTEGP
jgi:serine/threonine protein kinase